MEINKKYPLVDLVQTKILSFWVYNNYAYVYKSYLESYSINNKWEIMGDYQKKPILDSSLEVWSQDSIYYIQNNSFNWVDEVYYEKSSPIEIWNYSEYAINCFSARYDLKISEMPFDNDEINNIKIFYKFENLGYYPNSEQLDLLVKEYLRDIVPDWGIQYSSKDSTVMDKNRVYHFFDYHFKLYKGNCYDFINHCDKIINEVWQVESSQNLKSQKYFDEWKTEKVVEYGLDRSKLGLEPVTTPEPPQIQNEETEDLKDGDLWDKLALIHYLNKHKLLKLDTLHQDNTKIANVFSFLIGKSSESIRQKLSTVRKNDFKPSLKNLESILPIVKFLDHKEMIEEIETEIEKYS